MEQDHWLDNFRLQEHLALETYKAQVHVNLNKTTDVSTMEKTSTMWPLFFNGELTWDQLAYAVAAEIQVAQEWCEDKNLMTKKL